MNAPLQDPEKLAAFHKKVERYHFLEAKERYESSLLEFVEGGWSSVDSATYQPNWAIDALCDHLEAVTLGHIPRLLINFPPRCSKTSVTSIAWPSWTWARTEESYWSGPKVKFLCGSYNSTLSLQNSNKTRQLLLSPWYQKYWGDKFTLREDQNTKTQFDNTLGGSRQATSVGGSLLGLGGDIICLPYGERVLTTVGWLPIGEIVSKKLPVKVAGLSDSGTVGWQDIEKYEKNPGRRTVTICWATGSLRCTEDHPVYVEGRGYTPASEVKAGEVVWTHKSPVPRVRERVLEEREQLAEAVQQGVFRGVEEERLCPERLHPVVQDLRKSLVLLRRQKKAGRRKRRAFLFQALLWGFRVERKEPRLERWSGSSFMQGLWGSFFGQACLCGKGEVLFERLSVQEKAPSLSAAALLLWKLFSGILHSAQKPKVLLAELCGRGAFFADARAVQRAVRARKLWPAVPSGLVQKVQECYPQTRPASLPALREDAKTRRPETSRSPHRLRQGEFGPYEFDYGMQGLSRGDARKFEAASGLVRETVCSVERAGWEDETYNLCVGPYHNYFAEGVLTHNCVDDPHNTETEKVVETDADRMKVASWWREMSGTRLNDPKRSAIVVVMQRLHERDLSGIILDSDDEDWVHLMIPMEHDTLRHCVTVKLPQYEGYDAPWEDPRTEEGELMWPERFGPVEVKRMQNRLGAYMAAGRMQQAPVPKGGGIIKRDWWQLWDQTEAQKYGLEWTAERKEFPPCELIVASLDTAFKEKEENDFNAMTVWGVWQDRAKNRRAMLMFAWNKRLPLNGEELKPNLGESAFTFKERQKEAWGVVEWVADTAKRYKVKRLLIEDKARGIDVANELKRQYKRENWGIQMVNPVQDKVSRAHSTVPLFTDRGVWCPDTKWAEMVITQCQSFPKGEHDDLVDSVTQFLNWARENDILVMTDEMSAAAEDERRYKPPQESVARHYGL